MSALIGVMMDLLGLGDLRIFEKIKMLAGQIGWLAIRQSLRKLGPHSTNSEELVL